MAATRSRIQYAGSWSHPWKQQGLPGAARQIQCVGKGACGWWHDRHAACSNPRCKKSKRDAATPGPVPGDYPPPPPPWASPPEAVSNASPKYKSKGKRSKQSLDNEDEMGFGGFNISAARRHMQDTKTMLEVDDSHPIIVNLQQRIDNELRRIEESKPPTTAAQQARRLSQLHAKKTKQLRAAETAHETTGTRMQEMQAELEKLASSYEETAERIDSLQDSICELEVQMSTLRATPTGAAYFEQVDRGVPVQATDPAYCKYMPEEFLQQQRDRIAEIRRLEQQVLDEYRDSIPNHDIDVEVDEDECNYGVGGADESSKQEQWSADEGFASLDETGPKGFGKFRQPKHGRSAPYESDDGMEDFIGENFDFGSFRNPGLVDNKTNQAHLVRDIITQFEQYQAAKRARTTPQ